jgi:hypothetical protein
MTIVIGSAFRNAAHYVPHYFEQVRELAERIAPHNVRVIAVEGDSADNTVDVLTLSSKVKHVDLELVKIEHGHPWFGSTENPDRMCTSRVT